MATESSKSASNGNALSVNEIKTLHKELGKAMNEQSTKDILVLLGKLKSGVVPTEEVIRSTKIGQIVGKLRSNSNSDISSQAKDLVQGWKAVIDKERAAGKSSSSTSNGNSEKAAGAPSSSSAGTSRNGSATPNVTAKSNQGSASPASNDSKTTTAAPPTSSSLPAGKKPDFTTLNDKTRNACLKLIFDALKLADAKEVTDSQIFSISLDIESSIYKRLCPLETEVTTDYRNKIRSLSLNLKDKNNPTFRRKVVLGHIEATSLVDLTPKEMASEEKLAEYKSLEEQNLLTAQSAAEQEAETDAFQCGRCKQRKCRYYQKQTRSADEPMTTFVTCTNCNNKWKFC
ncbi:unnamed protein product [Sympodiomycopsis kandeliae]